MATWRQVINSALRHDRVGSPNLADADDMAYSLSTATLGGAKK
jgi:hypothetical protein